MFCPECGADHHAGEREVQAAEAEAVAIARINAERDVKVAQISARQERDWNETHVEVAEIEADASVEVAAAEAEVIGTILAEADPPEADPGPVITVAPDMSQEADPEELPPVEGSPAPEASKTRGLGMWG